MKIKFQILRHNFYIHISRYETLAGLTSQIEFDRHIIFWDFDNTDRKTVYRNLKRIQEDYDLSDIYVYTDNFENFRAICFKVVNLLTLLKIIINTEGVDMGFIKHTAQRSKAVLRLSPKGGRPPNFLDFIVSSYYAEIPKKFTKIIYDSYIKDDKVIKNNA